MNRWRRYRPSPQLLFRFIALATAGLLTVLTGPIGAAGAAPNAPDLAAGVAYLVDASHLKGGHYYESFPGFADFGLTVDGAYALAATGGNDRALKGVVTFLDRLGADPGGQTINTWTAIGTRDASGGAIGKEALLAQIAGYDPRAFGGRDLIAGLADTVCTAASRAPDNACVARGNYSYSTSVFAQALGVMAQLRAGAAAAAAQPIAYLERLQTTGGAWPSTLPSTGDEDVDGTAMAVMALDLVDTAPARTAVTTGIAWIGGQQSPDGGFPGVAPDSVNSTGLAIQAMNLAPGTHGPQIRRARAFLAARQNVDGGFDVSRSTAGSDVRASAQAISGAVGVSFATLDRDVSALPTPPATPTRSSPPPTRSTSPTRPATPPTRRSTPPTRPSTRSVRPPPAPATAPTTSSASVAAPAGDPGRLAATGRPVTRLLVTAVLLIGLGSLLVGGTSGRAPRRPGRHR